jgi:hypothetical protein
MIAYECQEGSAVESRAVRRRIGVGRGTLNDSVQLSLFPRGHYNFESWYVNI